MILPSAAVVMNIHNLFLLIYPYEVFPGKYDCLPDANMVTLDGIDIPCIHKHTMPPNKA